MKSNFIIIDSYRETYSEKFNKKRPASIMITEKELFIREFEFSSRKDLKKFLDGEIKTMFDTSKFLFHHEIETHKKKKVLTIYGINANEKIEILCSSFKIKNIYPIQYLVANAVKKAIKNRSFIIIYNFAKTTYFIDVEDGSIKHNKLYKQDCDVINLEEILNYNHVPMQKNIYVVRKSNESFIYDTTKYNVEYLEREAINVP
ncbi:hypothetical protein [Clostridium folliculivorans]|uniref:Uncharacterized protein n=1 Tax=Clostridium folliculivorans TaxID=2886038 RepID=A0A9W5XZX5_9CLOT|nr:hypothetical protein [Clostridium folliculivorans]GKU23982.1 hypothetical protein CFOLD11_08080 [Clostridium folliculivorans]GKU30097.1 hypothetical protein CFB3_22040 [Clostridium folliculivorans]